MTGTGHQSDHVQTMYSREATEALFRKLFKSGMKLRRLPKNRAELEVFLALAASVLDPQAVYSEPELNLQLAEWMADFTHTARLDHVTVRRYLVDYRFLLRDQAGTRYRTNQVMINTAIEPDARSVLPARIYEQAHHQRAARRRSAASQR